MTRHRSFDPSAPRRLLNAQRAVRLLLLVLVVAASCRSGDGAAEGTISRERFVEVNVALREIDRDAEDADSLRDAVLAEHRVTEEELRRFVEARGGRPLELSEVWAEIHQRLVEAAAARDSAARRSDDPGIIEPARRSAGPARLSEQPVRAETARAEPPSAQEPAAEAADEAVP